jgi:hypothetical protein
MYTLQYQDVAGQSQMQEVDANRTKMVWYLSTFEHPILAVYENASPVTKSIRAELAKWPGTMTATARAFATS